MLRYRGTFGPVGVAATAAYITSGRVQDSATPQRTLQYNDLSVGDFGAAITAYGFSFGGHYTFGQFTGQYSSLIPKGIKDSEAWLAGVSYTTGPFVMGAHYLEYSYAGTTSAALLGRRERDTGAAAGATYALVPGVTLFASYVFQQRRQNGVNLVTGVTQETDPNGGAKKNKLSSNVFGLGTSFRW